ncbi:MAG: hypothetical protein K1W19_00445 [Lachnospiraceae bacterium]
MMFSSFKTEYMDSEELRRLVNQIKTLTRGGYDAYDANAKTILRCLDKILLRAKEEKEWYLYFRALYYMLYELNRQGNSDKKILKYAEVFYYDQQLYMDRELPNYSNTNMSETNTDCMDIIFSVYRGYCQIQDEKMDDFMRMFEKCALKYGHEYIYYNALIRLGLLYHDMNMVKKGKENFEKCRCDGCYVCNHYPHFGYYLMFDDLAGAEDLVSRIINKNIAQEYKWCYKYCQRATEKGMYARILCYCIQLGKTEMFLDVFERKGKYLFCEGEDDDDTTYFLFRLCAGDVSGLEDAVKQAVVDIELEEKQRTSTLGSIYDFLCWYCYFHLLEKSGILKVKVNLGRSDTPRADKEGLTKCGELGTYYERKADEVGTKFAKSRKMFDYEGLKKSYEECIGIGFKDVV